jgi:hypothetical protein
MGVIIMTVRSHDARSAMYRISGRRLMVVAGPRILTRRRAMTDNGVSDGP